MLVEAQLLSLLGRAEGLFARDADAGRIEMEAAVAGRSFLLLGGAGSIGQAVVKALVALRPERLHVVDLSENNLVELVRDIRSSRHVTAVELLALPLDCGAEEFDAFVESHGPYDFVLNLSAMKHVRSEKDPYSLMRMIRCNVLNTEKTLKQVEAQGGGRYFAVSSDKAVHPASAMGATKRAMELCLIRAGDALHVSSARFANVAFSDGSLLHGFTQRIAKGQPLSAPKDVRRYFVTPEEAATLCLLSCLLGKNREAVFPVPRADFRPLDLPSLAGRLLEHYGFSVFECESEEESRAKVEELARKRLWPCFFHPTSTTGEKNIEVFSMEGEEIDRERYRDLGVIQWVPLQEPEGLDRFLRTLEARLRSGIWSRQDLLSHLQELVPEFRHKETGRFLDSRM